MDIEILQTQFIIHNYLTCLLYILEMGQTACCQPNEDINMQYYNNRIINPLDNKSLMNGDKYTPIQKTLKLHQYVQQTRKTLGKYQVRNKALIKSGGVTQGPHRVNSSGSVYVGEWKDQEPHGLGEVYFPDGSYYQGTFANGFVNGQGRFIFKGGSFYQGQVRHNVAEGKGVLINDAQQYRYVGEWLNDLPNGKGQQMWGDGFSYKGQFLNGKKHGKGQYKFVDGTKYQGHFKNDQFHGQGILNNLQGKYHGNFTNGKKEGRGIFKWKDGSIYQGDYKQNKKHGFGKYIDKDGKTYQGGWKNGYRQGEGIITNQLGQSVKGKWHIGQFY